MGVPAFFRWLVNSSPQVVTTACYNDSTKNPQIDNLYLDMNGIIHPCSHPQGQTTIPQPSCEQEMFNNIQRYLDLIFELTNPQKLIYFAIDGVAPRAKMNQQRGRRFRSAQEILEKKNSQQKVVSSLKDIGYDLETSNVQKQSWDHNVITPGTIFMDKVSNFLKSYICKKFQQNEKFENLVIIFSDSNVPQEGEHKILEFIRSQRNYNGYDPNTSHCIYGADADLIMLGLSTHEPNFYIIREKLEYGNQEKKSQQTAETFTVQFSFIYIQVVREFLNSQTFDLNKEQQWDLENIIDDFVLLCFIVGNDFLPSLPGFEIRMGGIDILLEFYKKCLRKLNGYLTFQGEVQLQNLEIFFYELSKNEYELMQNIEKEKYYHIKRMKEREENNLNYCKKDIDTISKSKTQIVIEEPLEEVKLTKKKVYQTPKQKKKNLEDAQEIIQDTLKKKQIQSQLKNIKNFEQVCIDGENYKQKYYLQNFKLKKEDYISFVQIIKKYYIEGIVWNFHYYYKGCCSWNWFYPFHYAPLISDLNNFSHIQIDFEKGQPFTPLQQLLSVLPPFSSHALPQPLAQLMTDNNSEIIDFYPSYFEVDQRGKTVSWLGEVILPFIDGQRLKNAVDKVYNKLSEQEKNRDRNGFNLLVTKDDQQLRQYVCQLKQIEKNQIYSDNTGQENQNDLLFFEIDLPQNIQHRCQLLRGVHIPQRTFNISVIQKGKNKQT